jgi:spore germination protein KA
MLSKYGWCWKVSFGERLARWFVFRPPQGSPFELVNQEAGQNTGMDDAQADDNNKSDNQAPAAGKHLQRGRGFVKPRRAVPVSDYYRCGGKTGERHQEQVGSGGSDDVQDSGSGGNKEDRSNPAGEAGDKNEPGKVDEVSASLKKNLACFKKIFHVPTNKDVIFREFTIGTDPPVASAAVYVDGMTDRVLQNLSILEPLMLLSSLSLDRGPALLDTVVRHLLPGNQVDTRAEMRDVVDGVLMGSTVILVDSCSQAIIVETKGWEHRNVERPTSEMVILGPQEGFTETLRVNTALIRKSLHSPDLVTEFLKVGRVNRVDCAIMYLAGLTNTQLVEEVKRRVSSISTDFIIESGMLEQFIEDNPFSLFPQTHTTERPDRVVAGLVQGQAVILSDGSPFALLVPATFFSIFQASEDAYVRWPYGSMLRIIRLIGLLLATFLPGFYMAVVNYHHEMIPTDLLMSITAARENVPFPSIVEVLLMEVSFELIREAGIRIPGIIGPTLSIVGALILGQAAVAAGIVSPILIIIVALTATGSYVIPNYSLSLTVRLLQFVYIFLGAVMGIYGLMLGFFIQLHLMAATKSFGVPYLAPLAPLARSSSDLLFKGHVWQQEYRPEYLLPQDIRRQPAISRRWINRFRFKGGKVNNDRRR